MWYKENPGKELMGEFAYDDKDETRKWLPAEVEWWVPPNHIQGRVVEILESVPERSTPLSRLMSELPATFPELTREDILGSLRTLSKLHFVEVEGDSVKLIDDLDYGVERRELSNALCHGREEASGSGVVQGDSGFDQ